jgi:[protein-PII] uridylyltransferase
MASRVRTSSSPPRGREPRGERRLERADAFRASMPVEYRNTFDEGATREHAAIVERRAGAPVHVETWRQLPSGGAIVCIVADDRPGLLSLISASLTAARMDILSMQAYTRAHSDAELPEAVDFVWLRREGDGSPQIGSADASRVVEVLRGLIAGDLTPESLLRRTRSPGAVSKSVTRVDFAETLDAGHSVLNVEASDRPGLLLTITLALFRARVQIVASRADTKDGYAADRFTIAESDGARLSPQRRGEVRAAVHTALDAFANRAR